jgi:RES domain
MTNLCPYCFNDSSFRRRLKELRPKYPRSDKCEYHPNRSGIPVQDIAPLIDAVIGPNYHIGEFRPCPSFDSDKPDWEQEGDSLVDIVYELTGAETDDIANDIVNQLVEDDPYDPRDGGEPFYGGDQTYVRHRDTYNPHSVAWEEFKREIVYHRRFFSSLSRDRLSGIFDGIHMQKDQSGKSAVYKLRPEDGIRLFRARQIDDPEKRNEAIQDPANQLGSPPKRIRTAGRMNAAGVPAFYGAFDLDTCIAEIRPVVGSVVVGASFKLTRPVVVLDTTRFSKPILPRSLFSPVYNERLQQWSFMQRFMFEICQPILPDDVTLDYIPSQAVSEFIHSVLEVRLEGEKCSIDAIIFRSAQRPEGRNIVLFGDAALVAASKPLSDPSTFEPSETDGLETWAHWTFENPKPALSVIDGTVTARRVEGVTFTHDPLYEHSAHDYDEDYL